MELREIDRKNLQWEKGKQRGSSNLCSLCKQGQDLREGLELYQGRLRLDIRPPRKWAQP